MGARDISGGSPGQARLHLRMSGDMVGNMEEHGEGRDAGTGSTLLLLGFRVWGLGFRV